MVALELNSNHGWVAAVGCAAYLVHHVYMNIGVVRARKQYKVGFPTLYASEVEVKDKQERTRYNCVQRAHQNSLENLPSFYALLGLAGLRYPGTAAVAGAVYLLGRVVYFNGYCTGEPAKRMQGAFSYFGVFTLLGCGAKLAYDLISNK